VREGGDQVEVADDGERGWPWWTAGMAARGPEYGANHDGEE